MTHAERISLGVQIARLEQRLTGDLDPLVRRDIEDDLVRLLAQRWEKERDVRAELPTIAPDSEPSQ